MLTLTWVQVTCLHFLAKKVETVADHFYVQSPYTITEYCIQNPLIAYQTILALAPSAMSILRSDCIDGDQLLMAVCMFIFPALFTFRDDSLSVFIHTVSLLGVLICSIWIGGVVPLVFWFLFLILYALNRYIIWGMPVESNFIIFDYRMYTSSYFFRLQVLAWLCITFEFLGIIVSSYFVYKRFEQLQLQCYASSSGSGSDSGSDTNTNMDINMDIKADSMDAELNGDPRLDPVLLIYNMTQLLKTRSHNLSAINS